MSLKNTHTSIHDNRQVIISRSFEGFREGFHKDTQAIASEYFEKVLRLKKHTCSSTYEEGAYTTSSFHFIFRLPENHKLSIEDECDMFIQYMNKNMDYRDDTSIAKCNVVSKVSSKK